MSIDFDNSASCEDWVARVRSKFGGEMSELYSRGPGDIEIAPIYFQERILRQSTTSIGISARAEQSAFLVTDLYDQQWYEHEVPLDCGNANALEINLSRQPSRDACVAGAIKECLRNRRQLRFGFSSGSLLANARDLCALLENVPLGLAVSMGIDPCLMVIDSRLMATGYDLAHLTAELQRGARANSRRIPWAVEERIYCNLGADDALGLGICLASMIELQRSGETSAKEKASMLAGLELRIGLGTDLLQAIGKLSAARMLCSRLYELLQMDVKLPSIHAYANESNFTALGGYNNILRAGAVTYSAQLGGATGLTLPVILDVAYEQNNIQNDIKAIMQARRTSRELQLVALEEANLRSAEDPVAGSYYLEDFSHQLAQRAWQWMQDIERRGGVIEAAASGFIAKALHACRRRSQEMTDGLQRKILGITSFPDANELDVFAARRKATSANGTNESHVNDFAAMGLKAYRQSESFEDAIFDARFESSGERRNGRRVVWLEFEGETSLPPEQIDQVNMLLTIANSQVERRPVNSNFKSESAGEISSFVSNADVVLLTGNGSPEGDRLLVELICAIDVGLIIVFGGKTLPETPGVVIVDSETNYLSLTKLLL